LPDLFILLFRAFLGLSIFLLGLTFLTQTLKIWASPKVTKVLVKYTSRPFTALLAGLITAAGLQSSSMTNVMVVSLVSAGVIKLPAAFAVILGSNIGTTLTAQIIALPLDWIAEYLLLGGVVVSFLLWRKPSFRYLGFIIAAIGTNFMGLTLLTNSLSPVLEWPKIKEFVTHLSFTPWHGVLVGVGLTAILQSSGVVTGMAIGLVKEGAISGTGAISISLGCNVGTVMTTLLATVGGSREARRAAVADLLFNILGVLIFLPVINHFIWLVCLTASEPWHQVANAHTLFNGITALVALPCIPWFCQLIRKIIK
jgi:phosphate:Na+ symporter